MATIEYAGSAASQNPPCLVPLPYHVLSTAHVSDGIFVRDKYIARRGFLSSTGAAAEVYPMLIHVEK